MTTIAFDGITLAADRCSWSGGSRSQVRKVFKIKNKGRSYLVAFSGNGSFCMLVLNWMRGTGERPNPAQFFTADQMDRQCCVAVDERMRIFALSNDLFWRPVREKKFASGAGQDFAWGALEAGATAAQAIRIAAKRSDYAGLGVDAIKF